ncbi:MAG: hypothetical protein QM767_04955 [Anaeromyxobacter sp.]
MKAEASARSALAVAVIATLVSLGAARLEAGSPDESSRLAVAVLLLCTLVKVGLLGLAATWIWSGRRRLGSGHPAAPAWTLLALGWSFLAAGHATLGFEQIVIDPNWFPSLSDLLFLPGQALLAAALFRFGAVYRASDLFPDEGAARARAVVWAVALGVGGVLIVTDLRLDAPGIERAADVAYAVMDLAILIPLALLARQARTLGGRVGRAWALLLVGAALFGAADVTLGYLIAFDAYPSNLVAQFAFLLSYGCIAAGSRLQLALVDGEARQLAEAQAA